MDSCNRNNPDRPIGRSNTNVQKCRHSIPWLWEGVLAEEAVTLLSATEKTGKTTLLSLLLDRRRAGGELLGRTVYPGRTVVCSEENERLWTLRQPPLDFGPNVIFHSPGGLTPTRGNWKRFMEDLFTLHCRGSFDLVVIDTAASFMPLFTRNERTKRGAIHDLKQLAESPAGVLVLNQTRTMHRPLAAHSDILIEMSIPRRHTSLSTHGTHAVGGATRRRVFAGAGRYPGALENATAELNAAGTDYILLPESPTPPRAVFTTLQTLLQESPTPLSISDLRARWPGAAPTKDRLLETLDRAVHLFLFTVRGHGTATEPFQFALRSDVESAEPPAKEQETPRPLELADHSAPPGPPQSPPQ